MYFTEHTVSPMINLWFARTGRAHGKFAWTISLSILIANGCASNDAQKRVENVAKDWCNTIRGSQVIPVYPLTADLTVGDVFLVQTPISTQAKLYRQHGFLALDNHLFRLPITNFDSVYFNGYWTNTYRYTPHPFPSLPESSYIGTNAVTNTLADAPRVAFPTFTFQAKSSSGLSAAFPVEGIPIALNYLRSDNITGSVAISDARTYAADESYLRSNLITWASNPFIRGTLVATAKAAAPTVVYLRVVSRIYLARAMQVSLFNASQSAGGARAGNTPDFALLGFPTNTATSTSSNSTSSATNVAGTGTNGGLPISSMFAAMTNVLNQAQAGGSAKYVLLGQSSVTMNQVFDQLLTVGYLGFDVPIYENGSLGSPIPTFQRLENNAGAWIRPVLDARSNMKTLTALVKIAPSNAVEIMTSAADTLEGNEFRLTKERLDLFNAQYKGKNISYANPADKKALNDLLRSFKSSTDSYLSRVYWLRWFPTPQRLNELNYAFDHAWAQQKAESGSPTDTQMAAAKP